MLDGHDKEKNYSLSLSCPSSISLKSGNLTKMLNHEILLEKSKEL